MQFLTVEISVFLKYVKSQLTLNMQKEEKVYIYRERGAGVCVRVLDIALQSDSHISYFSCHLLANGWI